MSLSEKQQIFSLNLAKLIEYINSQGYKCALGEVHRTPEQAEIYAKEGKGIKDSLHCKKLAADLFLFKEGKYLTDKHEYAPFGCYWESLNKANRWGGLFVRMDSVHFEMQDL